MKRIAILFLTIIFAALTLPQTSRAAMSDYCSAPPYVTRSILPNIMINLDNSCDMLNPAYDHSVAYDTNTTYAGYFISNAYYYQDPPAPGTTWTGHVSANQFSLVCQGAAAADPFFVMGAGAGTALCGGTITLPSNVIVFKGNWLNYITMSRFDLLQKILTGGNAAVARGAGGVTSGVKSVSGSDCPPGQETEWEWTDPTNYPGCKFEVEKGELEIERAVSGTACTTASGVLIVQADPNYSNTFFAKTMKRLRLGKVYDAIAAAAVRWGLWPDPHNDKVKDGIRFALKQPSNDSWEKGLFAKVMSQLTGAAKSVEDVNIVTEAHAANVSIDTSSPLPSGTVSTAYSQTLAASGGAAPYTWSLPGGLCNSFSGTLGLPPGLSLSSAGVISGTPTTAGTYKFEVKAKEDGGASQKECFNLTINAASSGNVTITTVTFPNGAPGSSYSQNLTASFTISGTTYTCGYGVTTTTPASSYTCTWSIRSGSLPAGLSLASTTGTISGTPTTTGTSNFNIKVDVNSGGTSVANTNKDLSITIAATTGNELKYKIWVQASGTDFTGGSLPSDAGTGLIQKFWGKANWGLTNFDQAGSVKVKVNECVGTSGLTQFLNAVDTAVPNNVVNAPLADSYYGIIDYFRNVAPAGTWFQNSCGDPFASDTVKCRKNFVLTLSSAFDLSNSNSNTNFTQTGCTVTPPNTGYDATKPLIQNTCYAYKNDLRSTKDGTQNLYHYAVFTFAKDTECVSGQSGTNCATGSPTNGNGSTRGINKNILMDSALTAGGKFYDASQGSQIEAQITNAITDILGQAASGTAVSVLTTSSRGIGSMVQAYFLPTMLQGTREVGWTGYLQNIWIDPKDNLREDTVNDYNLKLNEDNVLKLYYDSATNDTKAATFTTDADGNGGSLASCSSPTIKAFSDVKYLWEAGKKLALRRPNVDGSIPARNLFTSKNVLRSSGTTTITTTATNITANAFTMANVGDSLRTVSDCTTVVAGDARTMCSALNPDATYTAGNIVSYIRGECLETGALDNTACGAAANNTYRDRRVSTINGVSIVGGDPNGNVWKLGDIISSTPKVFSSTPLNTYHIDYGDNSYYSYISSTSYKQKSSIAFVGANDGMLHAFRVGYLKDTGLLAGVKALFKNFYSSTDATNDKLGEEVWGYIPFNGFPYLKYLADTGYCHIYLNDLSVRLVDASLGDGTVGNSLPSDPRIAASWRTILIGGMRFGGACSGGISPTAPPLTNVGFSSYFAIDITDPENPAPLWEFSDDDLGYTTTFPSIARTNAGGVNTTNGNWYVVIGSGSKQLPKSGIDISRTSNCYIYLLNLNTGALVKKVDLGSSTFARPLIGGDILAIDADKDYVSEKIYFGGARQSDSATCTASSGTSWCGDLYMIDIPQLLNTAGVYVAWGSARNASGWGDTLFTGNYPFTASPDAARDSDGNIWVYAGSGKYYSDVDETDTSRQIFMGIKDQSASPYSTSNYTYIGSAARPLDDRTNTNVTGTVTGTAQVCTYDSTSGSFGLQTVVTSVNQTSTTTSASQFGWYLSLPAPPDTGVATAERVITRPLAVGGIVDFLTYRPSSDVCAYGGSSYLYAVGYTTGVAPASVAILSNQATSGTSGSVTVNKSVLLGPGAPPTGEAIIVPPPKEGQGSLKKKIQIATGVIVEAENEPVTSAISKIVHWLKK
ncbi:MAG: putative Ig domain-containing protein [Deltaproteobacteria bacterium]|nr:putative Ig domain-containing protein [Deltaproteobacteria bacterium]